MGFRTERLGMTSGTQQIGPSACTQRAQPEKPGALRHPLTAWIVLAICCAASLIGWGVSRSQFLERESDRFHIRVRDIRTEVDQRIRGYERALVAARAFLTANPAVDRQSWRAFVEQLNLRWAYSGLAGMGFIASVPAAELPAFLSAARADGAPEFVLRPEGQRSDYFPILYSEPMEGNQLALGFDIGSDPVRRGAAEASRDSGKAMLTPRLDRNMDPLASPAVLFLLPVYRSGTRAANVEERRAALQGWVCDIFRIADDMAGVVNLADADVDFEIFDGPAPSAENRLYDDDGVQHATDARHHSTFKQTESLSVGGRIWTLYFTTRPAFDRAADPTKH